MSVTAAIGTARRIERATDRSGRLPNLLAITAFAVATAALLVTLAGLQAFQSRAVHQPAGEGEFYVALAFVAAGLLIAPILTLGGVAARLTVGRRDHRLAVLRLAGATRGQVVAITLVEAARLALLGVLGGIALYAVAIFPLSRLRFQGRAFDISELIVPVWWLPIVAVGLTGLAVVSGALGLRQVAISPLGVAQRQTPPGLSVLRLLVFAAAIAGWLLIAQGLSPQSGMMVLLVVVVIIVAVINVVGPFVMWLIGQLVAAAARRPETLLAARRIVDSPRATWRSVGALGIGILVAGFGGSIGGFSPQGAAPEALQLAGDMRTGAFVTLGIITVIAATSTGVVQAARIIDRQRELQSLARAGVEQRQLVTAAHRETTMPLAITVLLAAGFCLLLLLPFARVIGGGTLLWIVLAIAASAGLMTGAVRLTAPLVRSAASLT